MAGWSVLDKKEEPDCFSESVSAGGSKRCVSGLPDKLRCWFDRFLEVFLREICTQDSVRPLPPILGNGQRVDLFKLFWAVRKKGGFDCVSDSGAWDYVAGECGLGSRLGGAVKLVYTKYLYLLERLLENRELEWSLGSSGIDLRKQLMDLQDEFSGMFTEVGDRKVKDRAGFLDGEMSSKSLKGSIEEGGAVGRVKRRVGNVGMQWDSGTVERVVDGVHGTVEGVNSVVDGGKVRNNNEEVKSEVVESGGGKMFDDDRDYVDVMIVNPDTMEVSSCRKRKRESFWEMVNWIRMVAADPCDPSIGSLPERTKWKSFGNEENWKRVLGAREAMCLKRNADSVAEQFNGQSNVRIMHPSMYDDHHGTSYNLRERQRLEKQQRTMSESGACSLSPPTSDMSKSSPTIDDHIEVRVGSKYQAYVPEWTGESSESDLKYLGTRDWPLEKPEKLYLIERDPVGKGRQESCGCPMPGSIECVRFHTAEKRLRVKQELGSAFYHWMFNMGEEVGLPWSAEEESKFKAIIKANPPSLGKTFWDDIREAFPKKSWRELVSFYFNVYILQRRGYQNRFTPQNIDSDDEDLESGTAINGFGNEEPNSSKSILKSPHKPQGKYR